LAQVIGDAANNVDIINSFFDANKGPGLCASTSQLGSRSAVSIGAAEFAVVAPHRCMSLCLTPNVHCWQTTWPSGSTATTA